MKSLGDVARLERVGVGTGLASASALGEGRGDAKVKGERRGRKVR